MRIFYYVLLLLIISFRLEAQQVKKIDCCYNVTPKAIIIINESTSNGTVSSTTTNTTNPSNGVFNLELKSSLNTSAGVYNSSGVLIRTLWNGVRYDGGCYSAHWDGLLDDGTQAPPGVYTAKVLSNNVTYDWLGVIGNTSTDHLGGNQILNPFHSMAIVNGTMYIASGYAERDFKTNKILLSDIGSLYNAVDPTQALTQTMFAEHVCTNGTYLFWAGGDPYSSAKSFIVASKPADDSQVTFTNGQPVTIGIDGRQYHSALIQSTTIDEEGSGLAASANFLFASRGDSTKVDVYDLRGLSGAKLHSYNLGTSPSALAVNGSYLWVSADNITKQYTIGSDGSLVATGLTINVNAGAIAVSSSGELAIADNNTQQIKFYNAQTGAQTGTLGQAGGYNNGPLVTYDKFMFVDKREDSTHPRIVYQPDGSFWFADPGNYRNLHFNADKSYKEQIAYVPTARSIAVDPNNPTQVFANALQYQVDYSKVATDINHSWVLKYNWNVGTDLNVFSQFITTVTLPNGHTYATGGNGDNPHLYDLLPIGAVYITDIGGNQRLEQDGSVWTRLNYNNDYMQVVKKNLTGFTTNANGSQTPIWGSDIVVATSPTYGQDPGQPAFYYNNTVGASTNLNRYFFFHPVYGANMGLQNNISTGNVYHLGSIKTGGNTWEWKTSNSTGGRYAGVYPQNGYFATNGGHSENCQADVNGSNVFWHVNDELGTWTEVSRTNHYNEDGLFIGHFGNDNSYHDITGDTRFWAGNSFKTALVKVGNNLYYFYCDESKHGGVHIVKVGNLASISEQTIPITVSGPITILPDPNSLMAGLPYQGTSFNGATGWAIENGTPTIQTTVREFDKSLNDISVSGGTSKVSRSLSNQSLTSYTISGAVNFTNSQFTFNDYHVYNLLEITDQAGKKIVAITSRGDGIWINNTVVAPYTAKDQNLFQDFSFTYNGSILTAKFANYPSVTISTTWDFSADRSRPGFLKIDQGQCCGRSDGVSMDLYKLRFVSGQ